ncbi:MAG: sterol desaturase family protein [Myxococcales bacterium]|nr:sterol desaturase family protein [Myxococcales bacterium]
MSAATDALWAAASHLPTKLISPEERLFWPYLLGAGLVAALYWRWHRSANTTFWNWLWPWRKLGRARLDLTLALTWGVLHAGGLFVLTALSLTLSTLGGVLWLLSASEPLLGPATPLNWPTWLVAWVYGLALFIAWDGSRFFVHWLMHKSDWLWQFHQVHHSAEVMTPLTLHRSHPVEATLFALMQWLVTVVVTTMAVRLFGPHASPATLLGVNALGFAASFLGGNLRHSHAAIAYPDWLERIFISPAQHQLHHSTDGRLQRSNLGIWLAVWDRMAGSLVHGHHAQVVTFGVAQPECNHDPVVLGSALIGPFRACISGPNVTGSEPQPDATPGATSG